ncbi:hypothetical protein D3C86_2243180 [compost metagenome]
MHGGIPTFHMNGFLQLLAVNGAVDEHEAAPDIFIAVATADPDMVGTTATATLARRQA